MTKKVPRIEGQQKVTGGSIYVDDLRESQLGFQYDTAIPVTSTIAVGKIKAIDPKRALAVSGVRAVMTHENGPKLKKPLTISMAEVSQFLPLQSRTVRYYGQCVAVVIADTLMAAQEGARLVEVTYEDVQPEIAADLKSGYDRLKPVKRAGIAPGKLEKGNAKADYAAAPVQVDQTYHAAPHHHNAMEPSAVIAKWEADGGVSVRLATQWHHTEMLMIAQAFGLSWNNRLIDFASRMFLGKSGQSKVRISNMMAGGAFGRNLNTVHTLLACMAAKMTNRPVKVILTRDQTYTLLSYRGEVNQRLRLGADEKGRLISMVQEPDVAVGTAGAFVEPVGEAPFQIYAHSSHYLQHRVAELDLNGTGWMRGPGISSAIFAVESAMDELAIKQGIDPLEIRLINHADVNPENGKPWSSKSLKACYSVGAEMIGWQDRPAGGTLRGDGKAIGYGMATSIDLGRQFPASARVELNQDGTASVSLAISEIGQGILSALIKISAESLGIPEEKVTLNTKETELPYAAGSIGSTGTFSNGTAIYEAAHVVKRKLIRSVVKDKHSPLYGASPSDITLRDGHLLSKRGKSEPIAEAMARSKRPIAHHAKTGRTFGMSKIAKASFGAVFVEIAVDPITMVIEVERMVGAFACGRILKPTIARNQIVGGMIWGMGQALYEETRSDPRSGKWINGNLAEALISTHADIPRIDVEFIAEDDSQTHPLGMKGLAEIGVIGPAPAIANAFFDATGKRLTSIPMLLEDRLNAPVLVDKQPTHL
ncbi:MAG: xanthine dehydrogenase family protein molybdopterin-binding subunit [Chloroflexota bacterium]